METAKEIRKQTSAALKLEKAAVKAAVKAALKLEKAALKAAMPPKKRGRPSKTITVDEEPLSPSKSETGMQVYEKLEQLRGFAQEVYMSLGAGHLESIYHAAMAVELRLAGIQYESEQVMPVTHKGQYVGMIRADIIVNKECVLEFKISGKLDDAKQQARQYMKLQGIQYGFVVMFPKTDGGKVQFVSA
jgi:GxxExxY protein